MHQKGLSGLCGSFSRYEWLAERGLYWPVQCLQLREKLLNPFHAPAVPHHEMVLAECAQLQRELQGEGPWEMGALLIKARAGQEESSQEGVAVA